MFARKSWSGFSWRVFDEAIFRARRIRYLRRGTGHLQCVGAGRGLIDGARPGDADAGDSVSVARCECVLSMGKFEREAHLNRARDIDPHRIQARARNVGLYNAQGAIGVWLDRCRWPHVRDGEDIDIIQTQSPIKQC